MDCAVSPECRSDPCTSVMYCAHPVSGTGNSALMYCYNMKPVSTSFMSSALHVPADGEDAALKRVVDSFCHEVAKRARGTSGKVTVASGAVLTVLEENFRGDVSKLGDVQCCPVCARVCVGECV